MGHFHPFSMAMLNNQMVFLIFRQLRTTLHMVLPCASIRFRNGQLDVLCGSKMVIEGPKKTGARSIAVWCVQNMGLLFNNDSIWFNNNWSWISRINRSISFLLALLSSVPHHALHCAPAGLDLPGVALVVVPDANFSGFLRTAPCQTYSDSKWFRCLIVVSSWICR